MTGNRRGWIGCLRRGGRSLTRRRVGEAHEGSLIAPDSWRIDQRRFDDLEAGRMHAGVSEWLVRRPLGEHARCTPRPQTGTEGDGEEIASAPGTGDYFFPPSNSHMPRVSTQRAFNFSQIWRPDVGDPG